MKIKFLKVFPLCWKREDDGDTWDTAASHYLRTSFSRLGARGGHFKGAGGIAAGLALEVVTSLPRSISTKYGWSLVKGCFFFPPCLGSLEVLNMAKLKY